MKLVPYAKDPRSLVAPGEATDYFELSPALASDAQLCVEMARVSYVKDRYALAGYLQRAHFELADPLDHGGTQGFVARGPSPEGGEVVVVAFRGTEPKDP